MVTPLARRLAGEAGIDLANLKGSGPHGRIVARDMETARTASAPAQVQATANIVVTADVALGQSLALCADVKAIELADVIIKAWAMALAAPAAIRNSAQHCAGHRQRTARLIGGARKARR